MNTFVYGDILVTYDEGMSKNEVMDYVELYDSKEPAGISEITFNIPTDAPEMLDVQWIPKQVDFERIRRITGYLVGDVKRWNDGKKAELKDRVNHGLGGMEIL